MSDSPAAPPPPDYAGAAKETAASNLAAAQQATKANRVNTYTPYGSQTYTQSATDPDSWTSNVALSSAGQSLLDQQNKTSQGLGNLQDAATQRVGATMGSAMPSAYDPTQATNNASQLINARLAPQQALDRNALNAQLANQGITQGSEAYTNAQAQLGRTQNDASQQAQLQGINLGQQQQAQQYGQQVANRNMPINELNSLRTGAQVTNPTFSTAPQQATTGGADMMAAANGANQYNMGLYNSQVSSNNSLMGAVGGLGAAALGNPVTAAMMFSDVRLKSNIQRIGTHDETGIGIYTYMKFGQPEIGVLAHELEAVRPEAVSMHKSGFKMIDMEAL